MQHLIENEKDNIENEKDNLKEICFCTSGNMLLYQCGDRFSVICLAFYIFISVSLFIYIL